MMRVCAYVRLSVGVTVRTKCVCVCVCVRVCGGCAACSGRHGAQTLGII